MIQSTNAETILVVDDNGPLREMIEVILCSAGYRGLAAENGTEALRLARNTPRIDLLLSDLEMPTMRGDALATLFSRLHPSAPILFVSSSIGPIETPQPFEFLAKPFNVAQLRDAVRHALRAQSTFAQSTHAA
jgi:CheY-like chemotaxis protein